MTDPTPPRTDSHFLDMDARRRVTLKAAHRRAFIARFGRIAFFVALALVAAPVGWFLLKPEPETVDPAAGVGLDGEAGVQRMTQPRFTGRDRNGRLFEVLAETAVRRPGDDANITELLTCSFLNNAEGEDGARDTRVDADRCLYNSQARTLELDTNVDLSTDDGYVFRTSQARVFIDDRRAEGDMPVEAASPDAHVNADRWAYEENGAILHFEGNVRSVISTGTSAAEGGEQ